MGVALSFVSGLLFAIGLGIAGMTDPAKVIGFLDFFGGAWDPSLAFVMGSAIPTYALASKFINKRERPLAARYFVIPSRRDITPRLVIGAVLFGVGWGLAGYCPGPAVASLASLQAEAVLFVGTMIAGMVLFRFLESRASHRSSAAKMQEGGAS